MNFLNHVRAARDGGASDLHFIAGLPPAARIDNEITLMKSPPIDAQGMRAIVGELLNEIQKEHLERTRGLCFSLTDCETGRIRVTVYYHAGCPEISVRLCSFTIPDAKSLGVPEVVDEFSRRPNGLVLVTGATGSGKTTTLNYMVDVINRERRAKVVMIEDPVEYVHRCEKSLIVQQEVHTDALSFPQALTHVLRQNPDVIVIGEMRELETIGTAITAAETGHLVLATLHTPNTVQAIERITAVFPASQQPQVVLQLANCLQGVVSQSLIPRADKSGRVLATEVLVATPAVRNIIRDNNLHLLYTSIETGRREGMVSMDQCLLSLYQKGIITYDAAISRCRSTETFKARTQRAA